jgi:hypothetical protein
MAQQRSTQVQSNEPGMPGFRRDPLGGTGEGARIRQLYNLERDLDHRIQYYRKCGKDPFDLLDPSKPDYMGKPELIAQYRLAALRHALEERARQIKAAAAASAENFHRHATPAEVERVHHALSNGADHREVIARLKAHGINFSTL